MKTTMKAFKLNFCEEKAFAIIGGGKNLLQSENEQKIPRDSKFFDLADNFKTKELR